MIGRLGLTSASLVTEVTRNDGYRLLGGRLVFLIPVVEII